MNLWPKKGRNGTVNGNGGTDGHINLVEMIHRRLENQNAGMRIVGIVDILRETEGIGPKYPPIKAFVKLIKLLKKETDINVIVKLVGAVAEIVPRVKEGEAAAREMQIILTEKNEKNAHLFVQILAFGDRRYGKISSAAVGLISNYTKEELQKSGITNVRGIFLEAVANKKLHLDTKIAALGALDSACRGEVLEEKELSGIESKLQALAVDMETEPRLKEVAIRRFGERTERPMLEVVENAEHAPFDPNEQTIEISTMDTGKYTPAVTQDINPMYLFIDGLNRDSPESRLNSARALVLVAGEQERRENVEEIERKLAERGSEFGAQLRKVRKILERMPLTAPSIRDMSTMPPAAKPRKPSVNTTYGIVKNIPKRKG